MLPAKSITCLLVENLIVSCLGKCPEISVSSKFTLYVSFGASGQMANSEQKP